MSSTNHDLALAAAEKIERSCGTTDDVFDGYVQETTQIIADTYSEPMAELERLRFALVNVIGHTGHLRMVTNSTEQLLDGLLKNIARIAKEALKECPHNEVAK